MPKIKYSIVVPVFNEEAVLDETVRRLTEVMEGVGEPFELVFVDDGSRDSSSDALRALCRRDSRVRMLRFSRNFGHQPAITAGMDYASGDAVVVIDCDLQDPPEVIPRMIEKWKAGASVVYGKRLKRKGESAFKKLTASLFYRTLDAMTEVDIPVDTGDFRLIDRQVLEALKSLPEHNRYVRGLVAWVGFEQQPEEYVREERFAGETKYPLRKMLKLAGDGLTAFSYRPLKFATGLGVALCCLAALFVLVLGIVHIAARPPISGLYYLGGALAFFQGLTLVCIGLLGSYVGRIADEAKNRPQYIVAETHGFTEEQEG